MSENPERLLAEALRAQARNAPPRQAAPPASSMPRPTPAQAPPTNPAQSPPPPTSAQSFARSPAAPAGPAPSADLAGGYGLLSGTEDDSLQLRRAASDLDAPSKEPEPTSHRLTPEPLPARWVFLLTASLGLAFGSVLGLLTL